MKLSSSMLRLHSESEADYGLCSRYSPHLPWLLLFILYAALACALHYPGFDSPMIYDSEAGISDKEQVFARGNPVEIMGMAPGRPLFMLTLYGNYLWHGMDPWFFRLIDALLLAATGLVLVILALVVLEIPNPSSRASSGGRVMGDPPPGSAGRSSSADDHSQSFMIAALLGLLFVVHPIQGFAVLYIWQRQALMACFFSCAALAAYAAGRSGKMGNPLVACTATSLLFLGGMLSKESAIALPLLLAVSELALFRQSSRHLLERILILAAIVIPPLIGYALVNHALQGPTTVHTKGILDLLRTNYDMAEVSLPEVLGTECRVLFSYLFMIVAPFLTSLPLVKAEVISRSLWHPPTTGLAAVSFVILMAGSAALARRRPVAGFGLLFFVVSSIPEAVLSPQYFFFGYRAILPMVGILLVLGHFLDLVVAKPLRSGWKPAAGMLLLVWLGGAASVTLSQARNWRPLPFWTQAFSQLPPLSSDVEKKMYLDVLINYGGELLRAEQYGEAVRVLKQAEAINSRSEPIHLKLGLALQKSGALQESLESYRKAAQSNPGATLPLLELGQALMVAGKTMEGFEILRKAVQLDPSNASAHLQLGLAVTKAGSIEQGLESLRRAVELDPGSVAARVHLGLALKKSGMLSEAIEHFNRAVESDPGSAGAYTALGLALEDKGDAVRAEESFQHALAVDPRSPETNFYLGNVLMKSGNLPEAIRSYQRALELRPDYPDANANLGTALLSAGRVSEAMASLKKALAGIQGNPELHNALGVAYADRDELAQAAEQFRKALEIDPHHAGAQENLARVMKEQRYRQ